MNCAMCGVHACKNGLENIAKNCPSIDEYINNIKNLYKTEENYTIAKVSTKLSSQQGKKRIEETMNFAREYVLGYTCQMHPKAEVY